MKCILAIAICLIAGCGSAPDEPPGKVLVFPIITSSSFSIYTSGPVYGTYTSAGAYEKETVNEPCNQRRVSRKDSQVSRGACLKYHRRHGVGS